MLRLKPLLTYAPAFPLAAFDRDSRRLTDDSKITELVSCIILDSMESDNTSKKAVRAVMDLHSH
jgi:hypothetical protein